VAGFTILPATALRVSVDYHMFFDRRAVRRAVDKAQYRVLMRAGQYVRQVAKRSIVRRPGPAPPGHPPHSHVGLLRDQIFYGYDRAAGSVFIGPRVLSRHDVPGLLEIGGLTRNRRDARPRYYPPRPYMGPALERSARKIQELWRDSVRG